MGPMRSRACPLLLCAVLLATAPARAADLWAGIDAYERGDLQAAVDEWLPLARSGDVEAQYRLGALYAGAHGELGDDGEALRWYRAAADQGHPLAQNNLAVMLETGRGAAPDPAGAARWYRAAAEQGRDVAAANLARLYDEGLGVERSQAEAAVWYRRAAEGGHNGAQYRLGTIYAFGLGVPQDDDEAVRWLKAAARDGHAEAQYALGLMFETGRGVKQDRGKSRKWRTRAATQGVRTTPPDWTALVASGARDESVGSAGPDVEDPAGVADVAAVDDLDDDEGRAASPTAGEAAPPPSAPVAAAGPRDTRPPAARIADEADPDELYRMGREFEFGLDTPRDDTLAEAAYLRAAEMGHGPSAYRLGLLYFRGRGASSRREFVLAHHWFSVAAEQSVGDAAAWRDRLAADMSEDELARSAAM